MWALLLALLLPVIYILPTGFIYAMNGQGVRYLLLLSLSVGDESLI